MFKSEFQRRATAILESNFKTKIIQVTKQEKNMHSLGLQPKLRDAYVLWSESELCYCHSD